MVWCAWPGGGASSSCGLSLVLICVAAARCLQLHIVLFVTGLWLILAGSACWANRILACLLRFAT
jgi:hypothetical protein